MTADEKLLTEIYKVYQEGVADVSSEGIAYRPTELDRLKAGLLAVYEHGRSQYVQGEALKQIAEFPDEEDEWDAVEKYRKVREIAAAAMKESRG